ncbi:MAG: hypothetical protein HC917_18810 [Richelia sp. SM2_1_7]|nr:hypothetical protein [Richelia sp. SM2_1_7]
MSQSIKPFYLNIFSAKKYRTILLSAVLFLTFDLGVLLPNFLISSNLKKDAVSINLAGRQRMLSQKITKALLQVKVAQLAQRDTGKAKQELEKSFQLFDDTLLGFDRGKIVTGGDDKPVFLDGVTTTQAKEIIAQASNQVSLPINQNSIGTGKQR